MLQDFRLEYFTALFYMFSTFTIRMFLHVVLKDEKLLLLKVLQVKSD